MAATRQTDRRAPARTLVDAAAAAIRRRLVEGEFGVGERLPPERALVEELGVSRTVLREALSSLEALGLVEARTTRGRYVAAGSAERSRVLVSAWLHQHANEIGEFDEIRAVAEAQAVRVLDAGTARAAAAAAAPLVAAQRDAVAAGDALHAADLDGELHRLLCSYTPNAALRTLVEGLVEQMRRAALAVYALPAPARESTEQHAAIVAALDSGDATRAAELVREHHLRRRSFDVSA